jgi:hypothetical protein
MGTGPFSRIIFVEGSMKMRILMGISVLFLLLAPLAGLSQPSRESPGARGIGPFVGTWKLIQIEVKRRDTGEIIDSLSGTRVAGVLMYDSGGNMSVQLKREWNPNIPYTAYFGTYSVDPKAATVIHHVRMSTNEYKGTDQVRAFRFDEGGKLLTLTPVDAPDVPKDIVMRLTWRRIN